MVYHKHVHYWRLYRVKEYIEIGLDKRYRWYSQRPQHREEADCFCKHLVWILTFIPTCAYLQKHQPQDGHLILEIYHSFHLPVFTSFMSRGLSAVFWWEPMVMKLSMNPQLLSHNSRACCLFAGLAKVTDSLRMAMFKRTAIIPRMCCMSNPLSATMLSSPSNNANNPLWLTRWTD